MAQTKYHYNEKTGKVGVCKATEKRGCPLPGDAPHFETKAGGQQFAERLHENKYGVTNVVKKFEESGTKKTTETQETAKTENKENFYAPYQPKSNTPDGQANEFSHNLSNTAETIGRKADSAYDVYEHAKARELWAEEVELNKIAGKFNTIEAADFMADKNKLAEYTEFLSKKAADNKYASRMTNSSTNIDELKDKDDFEGKANAQKGVAGSLGTENIEQKGYFEDVDYSDSDGDLTISYISEKYAEGMRKKAADELKFSTTSFVTGLRISGEADAYKEIANALEDVISKEHHKEFSNDLEDEGNEYQARSDRSYFNGDSDNGDYYAAKADVYKIIKYTVDRDIHAAMGTN